MDRRAIFLTSMAKLPPASLRLAIDRDALVHNWRALDRLSGPASAGAAVKADCYGLGVKSCVPALLEAGARHFFVAHWREVPAVACHVPAGRISVLHGPMNDLDVAFARQTGAVPTINSLSQAQRWLEAGGGPCDLMVDTGINRLGISPSEAGDPAIGQLEIRLLMSHLACADEDSEMNLRQQRAFREIVAQIPHRHASLANSAGIALGADYCFDVTRPGLSLFGGVPRHELANEIRQVARPEAAIVQLRQLAAGDQVGYNATFTASGPMRVGVVSLGYADGLLCSWARHGGYLLAGEARLPILGKVSMDMVVVDLAEAPQIREGDWVAVPYALCHAAQHSGLSQYEMLTVLGQRLKSD